MTMTIRQPEGLVLAIDRIHDRWFDVDAIAYDPGTRVVKIPFWSKPTSRPPVNSVTGEPTPFESLLLVQDADEPKIEDREHIGTYSFDIIGYSNREIVITAEPNLRISCSVRSLHIEFGSDAIDQLVAKLARYPEANVIRAGTQSASDRPVIKASRLSFTSVLIATRSSSTAAGMRNSAPKMRRSIASALASHRLAGWL